MEPQVKKSSLRLFTFSPLNVDLLHLMEEQVMSKNPSSTWSTILKIVITVATAVLGVITGSSFSS